MNNPQPKVDLDTTTDTLTGIQTRLRRVERQNRILLTLCLGVIGVLIFTAAQNNSTKLEHKAHRFILLDDNDNPTAYWANTNGYPSLVFLNKKGVQRPQDNPLYLAATTDGVTIYLNGAGPGPDSTITLAAASNSYFSMASPSRAILELSPSGATQMSFRRVKQGETEYIFQMQNDQLGLYNLPFRFFNAQSNLVRELP